ncbi:M15 family metallopeptidase [Streptomyces sp. B21-102]|uniref:M15 family metallopeptidase n=1 Tax=Streptomyces sp. B21-102 TaxID=3039416 RepID=UPI003FA7E742
MPSGLRLLIVEGYRPPTLQRAYFQEYATELRHANPGWSDSLIHEAASRYVSPPQIAPHSAGAAVDLTLADQDGQEVDMGTRMNASRRRAAAPATPTRNRSTQRLALTARRSAAPCRKPVS